MEAMSRYCQACASKEELRNTNKLEFESGKVFTNQSESRRVSREYGDESRKAGSI